MLASCADAQSYPALCRRAPPDMLPDVPRAIVVIANYHAFKPRVPEADNQHHGNPRSRSKGDEGETIGVFVRAEDLLQRARAAVRAARAEPAAIEDEADDLQARVAVATMHAAKGLESRAVAVMACDDELLRATSIIP